MLVPQVSRIEPWAYSKPYDHKITYLHNVVVKYTTVPVSNTFDPMGCTYILLLIF